MPLINILLVDDDPDDIGFFKDALEDMACDVNISVALNSVQMFDQLNSGQNFDLIFLDINLPLVDGMECLKKLKENSLYRHIPVIMLTGSQSEFDIQTSFEIGAHNYIAKPNTLNDYENCLKACIESFRKKNYVQPARDKFQIKSESSTSLPATPADSV